MGYSIITTVQIATSDRSLAQLADVKAELGIMPGDTSQDALLNRYVLACSAAISQYCNRVFPLETVKDEIWPQREFFSFQVAGAIGSVQLSRWPVVALTVATENGEPIANGIDYRLDPSTGIVLRLDKTGYPREWLAWPLSFTYQAGYADVPDDIQDAAIRMVKARYAAKGRDPFLRSESIPGVRDATWWIATGSDAGNLPPDVEDILNNYRTPVLG